MTNTISCLICEGPAVLIFSGHWGFQAPKTFDIYECSECETSFVQPMAVDTAIYELIYKNADKVSGYDRYSRYRQLVKSSPDPLDALCAQEEVYWAIREAIQGMTAGRDAPLKVLEIGSGFGYLTYALRRAGYDGSGIDISEEAVKMAVREFGDFYRVADLMTLDVGSGGGYDVVVATELIEHVPNPRKIIAKAATLLRPGGALVVTTPNRDIYPRRLVWHTDPPPVHLWWFSKTSFRFLAWQLEMSTKFISLAPFYGRSSPLARSPSKPQTFDAEGNICFKDSVFRSAARHAVAKIPTLFRPLAKLLMTTLAIARGREGLFREGLSLCVVLQHGRVNR